MASFEQAIQALSEGVLVVISHKDTLAAVQGGGTRNLRVVVATICRRATIIDDYAADLPRDQQTDPLTREQIKELRQHGAQDDRDYIHEIMKILRTQFPGPRLDDLVHAGGLRNTCEAIEMQFRKQKGDDYDDAAFLDAVDEVEKRLEDVSAI